MPPRRPVPPAMPLHAACPRSFNVKLARDRSGEEADDGVGEQRERITGTLYAAVLSDVMDGLGLTGQAMRPFVRPLDEALVLFGRARTGLYMPRYQVEPGEDPYAVEIALVDDLEPGDIAVFACDGPTDRIAPWGELLAPRRRCAAPPAA